ncbi:MAG TPA: SDR family oxidoreductase, partial [Candidatus Dormibacteraeota bacterium]|nr:SDR family oxidoreductase [Candidatus Dormibacteraeota bacterium]
LVNNAGIIRRGPAVDSPAADWDAVMAVNLDSAFFLAQRFARPMLDRGAGKIINIASVLSTQGGINVVAYAAAKHGIAGLTRALANEWAPRGVQVNAIAPGYIRTNNTQKLFDDPLRNRAITERIPAGRWGSPADVVGAAVFLSSAASDYVNGHVLAVDGGWLSR